jgi:acyl-CoA thioester hydrolase
MAYEFQVTRRVEFSDTDMEGIMHYSNFFRFMETAEHAFFRSLGYSVVLSRNGLMVCLPRVHAECDYSAPLRFEDEVRVHLLVEKKGTRSLTYQFRFHRLNPSPPQEVARGRLTVVCAKRQQDGSLKAVTLPAPIAQQIQEAPRDLLVDGWRAAERPHSRPTNHQQARPPLRRRARRLPRLLPI